MNGTQPGATTQINPIEIAHHMLVFLGRVDFRAHERVAFDQCEMVCQALRGGQLVLAQPHQAQAELPLDDAAAPPKLDA